MLPKFFYLTLLCILLASKSSNALKCYDCDNCLSESHDTEECEGSQNVCMKVVFGNTISKGCQNENFCTLQNIEKGFNDAWDKVKNVFTGEEAGRRKPDAINCCYTDYCNSAFAVQSAFGFIGALFLALSLFYI